MLRSASTNQLCTRCCMQQRAAAAAGTNHGHTLLAMTVVVLKTPQQQRHGTCTHRMCKTQRLFWLRCSPTQTSRTTTHTTAHHKTHTAAHTLPTRCDQHQECGLLSGLLGTYMHPLPLRAHAQHSATSTRNSEYSVTLNRAWHAPLKLLGLHNMQCCATPVPSAMSHNTVSCYVTCYSRMSSCRSMGLSHSGHVFLRSSQAYMHCMWNAWPQRVKILGLSAGSKMQQRVQQVQQKSCSLV
jgi:hypothetical protein